MNNADFWASERAIIAEGGEAVVYDHDSTCLLHRQLITLAKMSKFYLSILSLLLLTFVPLNGKHNRQ